MKTKETVLTLWVDDSIQLHLLQPHHATPLYKLMDTNRDHIAKFIGAAEDITSASETKDLILEGLADFARNPAFASFGIFFEGELVGCIGYSRIKSDSEDSGYDVPEMSFWIAEAHQGKRIISRSAIRVMDYVLIEQQQARIEVHCAEDNLRSRRVAEKLGFSQVPSSFADVVIYEMTAERWRGRPSGLSPKEAAVM